MLACGRDEPPGEMVIHAGTATPQCRVFWKRVAASGMRLPTLKISGHAIARDDVNAFALIDREVSETDLRSNEVIQRWMVGR
jgi:hypothetical protein